MDSRGTRESTTVTHTCYLGKKRGTMCARSKQGDGERQKNCMHGLAKCSLTSLLLGHRQWEDISILIFSLGQRRFRSAASTAPSLHISGTSFVTLSSPTLAVVGLVDMWHRLVIFVSVTSRPNRHRIWQVVTIVKHTG
jgi:hypothetical protein